MTLSQRAGSNDSSGATCWMPALLTRMSTPPRPSRRIEHGLDGGDIGQVGALVADLDTVFRGHVGTRALDLVGVAEAVEDHVRPFGGERRGDAEADAAGGTGDECELSFHGAGVYMPSSAEVAQAFTSRSASASEMS